FSLLSNIPPTPDTHTLSLHDALPIFEHRHGFRITVTQHRECAEIGVEERERHAVAGALERDARGGEILQRGFIPMQRDARARARSEEHTSELQSREKVVCRLVLEKKKEASRWYLDELRSKQKKIKTSRCLTLHCFGRLPGYSLSSTCQRACPRIFAN